jgi:hypothetical protein
VLLPINARSIKISPTKKLQSGKSQRVLRNSKAKC